MSALAKVGSIPICKGDEPNSVRSNSLPGGSAAMSKRRARPAGVCQSITGCQCIFKTVCAEHIEHTARAVASRNYAIRAAQKTENPLLNQTIAHPAVLRKKSCEPLVARVQRIPTSLEQNARSDARLVPIWIELFFHDAHPNEANRAGQVARRLARAGESLVSPPT